MQHHVVVASRSHGRLSGRLPDKELRTPRAWKPASPKPWLDSKETGWRHGCGDPDQTAVRRRPCGSGWTQELKINCDGLTWLDQENCRASGFQCRRRATRAGEQISYRGARRDLQIQACLRAPVVQDREQAPSGLHHAQAY